MLQLRGQTHSLFCDSPLISDIDIYLLFTAVVMALAPSVHKVRTTHRFRRIVYLLFTVGVIAHFPSANIQ
jgi:hypothetical protein